MTKSQCEKWARRLFGPRARVVTRDGAVTICEYHYGSRTRTVFGEGLTFVEALSDCFVDAPEPEEKSGDLAAVEIGSQEK